MPGLKGGRQPQPRWHFLGQLDGRADGADLGAAAQPGQDCGHEAAPIGLGNLDRAGIDQALTRGVQGLSESPEDDQRAVPGKPPSGRVSHQSGLTGNRGRQIDPGPQHSIATGTLNLDDEGGRVRGDPDRTRLPRVRHQGDSALLGLLQQGAPVRAEFVQGDGIGHPAETVGADGAPVSIGDSGHGVPHRLSEACVAVGVVPAGEALPRDSRPNPIAACPGNDRSHAQARPAAGSGRCPPGASGATACDRLKEQPERAMWDVILHVKQR